MTRTFFRLLILSILFSAASGRAESISGFIRDNSSGEPLSFANVYLKNTDFGAISGMDGYYLISDVPPGSHLLIISYIGYGLVEESILLEAGKDLRRDVRLTAVPLKSESVTVTAERLKFDRSVEVSTISLGLREIKVSPGFVEADVFRTLQSLPGVQSLNDFSSALYVRGSTPDQNLIMLDGIAVYNPYHFGGVFSTFNTDAIKAADFSAGGFTAEYGGRMGSILNIINREGNSEAFSGSANISLISSKILLEGPVFQNRTIKGSWMIAGRRTYFDTITDGFLYFVKKRAQKTDPYYNESDYIGFPYHFYDLEGKLNLDVGKNHRLTLSSFYGDDIFHIDSDYESDSRTWDPASNNYYVYQSNSLFDWRWGNKMNAAAWRWIATPDLIIRTFLAQSRFRFNIDFDDESYDYEYSGSDTALWHSYYGLNIFDLISDYTLKSDINWIPNSRHSIKAGLEQKWLHFNLGMIFRTGSTIDDQFVIQPDTMLWMNNYPTESAAYLQDQWDISPLLSVKPGLRLSGNNISGKIYFEPRFGIKYRLTENLALKGSFGKYIQYLSTANPPDENLRFIDIWLSIPKDHRPSESIHSIVGIEYLTARDILFRAEAYYKDFRHLLTLKQGELFTEDDGRIRLDPFNEFYDTDAFAWGTEFLIKKSRGRLQGWIGYTYAVTLRRTEIENWYYPNYDRTHTLNVVGDIQLSDYLHLSSGLSYSSGNPYTPILGQMQSLTEDSYSAGYLGWYTNNRLIEGEKNSVRYPDYFRLDLSITQRKITSWGSQEWYFQIINITNHHNILTYIYRENSGLYSSGSGIERFGIPMFPIMPTFGVKFEF